MPFTATLDDQGGLVSMVVSVGEAVPAAGMGDMTVAYGGSVSR